MKRTRYRQPMVLAVLCGLVGWLGLTGAPAGAHVPPDNNVNFNPDEFNGDGDPASFDTKEGEIPSDAEDGFGTTYELRAVADSQTAFYEWYDCSDSSNPSLTGSACAPIATDTTGDAAPTPPGEGTALSFTGSYNIPSTSDGGPRDWYGITCSADANTGGPPFDTSHCLPNDVPTADFEPAGGCALAAPAQTCVADVHPDDAQTTVGTHPHAATTSGRIANFVTATRNFTQVEAHGAGLKNGDSLTVIAFTSAGGVDAVQVCMDQFSDDETPNDGTPGGAPTGTGTGCTHSGTDTSSTPGGGAGCHASAPTAAGGDCWAVTIGVPNANAVFGVSLVEYNDGADPEGSTFGTGDCAGSTVTADGDDCQLDKVYVTTTSAGESAAPPPPAPTPPGPPGPPTPPRPPARNLCDPNRAGANGNELILGTGGPDQLCGFGGDDTLRGKRGRDTLRGGTGNDVLSGGKGQDNLRGGSGDDSMRGGRGKDTLRGASGSDVARGGKGKDLCRAENRSNCEH